MKNLYLVTLNSDEHILVVASEKEAAADYCLPVMNFGQWIESTVFIAVICGDYQEGEIIKKF